MTGSGFECFICRKVGAEEVQLPRPIFRKALQQGRILNPPTLSMFNECLNSGKKEKIKASTRSSFQEA